MIPHVSGTWVAAARVVSAIALGAGVVWVLWITQPYRNQVFTTDTVVYADTALHIAEGKGISTGVIHLTDSPPQIPQVSWPPLYPLLVALFMKVGFSISLALQLVPVIAAALGSVVLAYYIVKHHGWASLVFFATLVLAARQVHRAGAAALTEGVFLGLLVIAQFAAMDLLRGAKKPWLAALILGFSGGLMVALRYVAAGVPLALLTLLMLRKQIGSAAIATLGFGIVTIPLFLRNFVFLRGFQNERLESNIGFFQNAWQAITSLGSDLWRQPVLLIGLVLAIVLILLRRGHSENISSAWLPALAMAGGLWGGTVLSRTFVEFDAINSRFVVPGEWVLLAPIAITLGLLLRGRLRHAVAALAVLAAVLSVRGSVYAWDPDRTWVPGSKNEWVAQHTEPNAWLIGNQALEYAYFARRTVTPLRAQNEPATDIDLATLVQRLSRQPVPVYLVLADPYGSDQHSPPMVALKNGRGVPGLTRVESIPSLTVYRVER